MESREAIVGSTIGLHARPAATFVKAAAACGRTVTIGKPGGTLVDATSILSVMALGAACGDTVVIAVDGEDAAALADELADLVRSNLDV